MFEYLHGFGMFYGVEAFADVTLDVSYRVSHFSSYLFKTGVLRSVWPESVALFAHVRFEEGFN